MKMGRACLFIVPHHPLAKRGRSETRIAGTIAPIYSARQRASEAVGRLHAVVSPPADKIT
jgi:hypothetical protein